MQRPAFTMIEVIVSTVIISAAMVAAVASAGSAARSRLAAERIRMSAMIADEIVGEIVTKRYADPEGGTGIGTDAGESTRSQYDDVDDYHNFAATPPTRWSGATFDKSDGWIVVVQVHNVHPTNPGTITTADSGLKRIWVRVRDPDEVWRQRYVFRARGGVLEQNFATDTTITTMILAEIQGPDGSANRSSVLTNHAVTP